MLTTRPTRGAALKRIAVLSARVLLFVLFVLGISRILSQPVAPGSSVVEDAQCLAVSTAACRSSRHLESSRKLITTSVRRRREPVQRGQASSSFAKDRRETFSSSLECPKADGNLLRNPRTFVPSSIACKSSRTACRASSKVSAGTPGKRRTFERGSGEEG